MYFLFSIITKRCFLQQIGQASMDRIENAQMNSLGTRKLYYEDVHQTDFTAVVMECVPDKEEGYYRIVLDASAFSRKRAVSPPTKAP